MLLIPFSAFFFSVSLYSSALIGSFLKISSSLLKLSLYLSILFPNSVSVLSTNALNSLSGKLFISVSFFFFFRNFLLLFPLKQTPLYFHFAYLFLYLLKSGETIITVFLLWVCPCTVCRCPVALMGGLDLM